VVDRSMTPTLVEGQGLVAVRSRQGRIGELRVVEHPFRPGFWLVKRVADVDAGGRLWVLSDNLDLESEALDSRAFGWIEAAGSYRVLWTVTPRRSTRSPSR
jgi:hypothetical protein